MTVRKKRASWRTGYSTTSDRMYRCISRHFIRISSCGTSPRRRRRRCIALDAGLHYVYEGNIFSDAANTYCPGCGVVLIERSWHSVEANRLKAGKCPRCAREIPGVWEKAPPHYFAENCGVEVRQRERKV